MTRNLLFGGFTSAGLVWLGVGCGDGDSDAAKRAADAERAREEAEAEAEAEAERQAEEAEQMRRAGFCDEWTELYCRSRLRCHPDITDELLEDCSGRFARFCDEQMRYKDWRDEAATECFDAAKDWDCSTPLEEFFSDTCDDVIVLPGAGEGDTCSYAGTVQCEGGSVCDLYPKQEGFVLDCDGRCVVAQQAGGDCSEHPCADGLYCESEEDERGLPVRVCREDPFADEPDPATPEEANGCAPHEQFVESEGRCIAKSLPGEACGGSFGIDCLATTCESGTCEWGISESADCTFDECLEPYQCTDIGTVNRCEVQDRSCSAHPMMLLQIQ